MKYWKAFRLVVIVIISLGILSTSYAAATPIRPWPVDRCAVAKVSLNHLPKSSYCSRSIVVRTKEVGDTLIITFQTRQPAVIQLTRAQFYNQSGQLTRDEPYHYPAIMPKPQDYQTSNTRRLKFLSDDEVKVVFSFSVRWLYQGGIEYRTNIYSRQRSNKSFMPTNPTLNPGPISHSTIPEALTPAEPAIPNLNERSTPSVGHDQPAPAELVHVVPNSQAPTLHPHPVTHPVIEPIVEPINHPVKPAPHDNSDQSLSRPLTSLTSGMTSQSITDVLPEAKPVATSEGEPGQV